MASFDGRTGAEDPGDAASTPAQVAARRRWMSVLAKASYSELQDLTVDVELPAFTWLRRPETGAVMVRGRAGGTGSAFNMGEMTITRCAVRIDAAATGHAYVQGRDPRHAELAALLDAMLQDPEKGEALEALLIAPLETAQRKRREARSRRANATKVDFFTMVRGENPK